MYIASRYGLGVSARPGATSGQRSHEACTAEAAATNARELERNRQTWTEWRRQLETRCAGDASCLADAAREAEARWGAWIRESHAWRQERIRACPPPARDAPRLEAQAKSTLPAWAGVGAGAVLLLALLRRKRTPRELAG